MKNFLPLILLLMSLNSFGQFKTIYPERTAFYKYMSKEVAYRKLGMIGESGEFIPVKIESTKIAEEDTLYNNYHIFGFTGIENRACKVTSKGAAWTGKRIIMSKDNKEIFINKNNDSIIFRKYANVGDSWIFFNADESSFIATVTKKETENISIYGNQVSDSVMTITILLKNDHDNTILEHNFNGREWKISKNYGFIKAYDLLNFPEDTISLLLAGDDKMSVGVKNLTEKEIYDFEVGDEFQIREYSSIGSPVNYIVDSKIRQKVLEKTIDNIKDSVFYKIEVVANKSINKSGEDSFAVVIDTVNLNVALHPALKGINEIPGKSSDIYGANYTCQFFKTDGPEAMTKFINSMGYARVSLNNSLDSCYNVVETLVALQIKRDEYMEGLGGPYYEKEYDPLTKVSRKLAYYKKGDKEGGVPTEFVLSVFPNKINLSVRISPNPATERIKISSEGIQNTYFKIYNNEGREVLNGNFLNNEEALDISGLRTGIYSLMIIKEGGVIYTSRFVKN